MNDVGDGCVGYHRKIPSVVAPSFEPYFQAGFGLLHVRPDAFVDDLDAAVGEFVEGDVEAAERRCQRKRRDQLLRQLKGGEEQSLELGEEFGVDGRGRLLGQIEGVDVPEAFAVDERVENLESVVRVEEKVLKLQAFEVLEGADGGFQTG